MLKHLQIRDFAIIEELELEFEAGLTALTGETGAGKSILLDALGLVLGDRADSTAVRNGARRAEITAEFDLTQQNAVAAWLAEQELDDGALCQLRRVVASEGRSRGFVNGTPVPLATLRDLGEQLVDIHGQHEHQSLRHGQAQRRLLDAYGSHEDELDTVRNHYEAWRHSRERLQRLGGSADDRQQRLELVHYQLAELEALDLEVGEIEQLEAEQRRLANAGRLLETCERGLALLHDEEGSVQARLVQVANSLGEVATFDTAIESAAELTENARIQIEEAASTLRSAAERVELDPGRHEWVEQRLSAIHELARKHRTEPEQLLAVQGELQTERDELEQADADAAGLEEALAAAQAAWRSAAEELTRARQTAASALGEAVTAAMQTLGMEGGRFAVEVQTSEAATPSASGADRVELRVAANPGQTPAPLHKVASGGELSRISLAIQLITSASAGIPTQIFDEVDAGIGGSTAAMVGAKLRALGAQRQVLCVTHLPQVAACGHHHLQVSKEACGDSVTTRLEELTGDTRVEEIARMLGGQRITDKSRQHAREMLAGNDQAASAASG